MSPDIIKTFRESRGWSQSELAQQLGVNQATVSRMENGETMPRPVELLLERLMADPAPEPAGAAA